MPQETKSLKGAVFCITGTLSEKRKDIQQLIRRHGGEAVNTVNDQVTHLIASEDAVHQETIKIGKAHERDIPIVSESFLRDAIKDGELPDTSDYLMDEVKGQPNKKSKTSSFKILSHTSIGATEDMDNLKHWQVSQILNGNSSDEDWNTVNDIFDNPATAIMEYLHYGTVLDDAGNKYQIVYYADGAFGAVFKDKEKKPTWTIWDYEIVDENHQIQDMLEYFVGNT